MSENLSSNAPAGPAKSVRTRDLALLVCSLVVAFLAVWYRSQPFVLGLVLLAGLLFWGAVLDSALHSPRRSRTVVFLASAMLIGIGVVVIAIAVLVMQRGPATTRQPAVTAPTISAP